MNNLTGVQRGQLFVFSAPSGAGKTTLVRKLMALKPELKFSISYTTRPQRPGERDGHDYFFVDHVSFESMRAAGDFLEFAEVFGNFYGTSRNQVERLLDAGDNVILEIDWQGAAQVRANMPDAVSIFILPPSLAELERRLRGRGTDSAEVIERRLGEAIDDISHWTEFDHAIINDQLDDAAQRLLEIVTGRAQSPDEGVRKQISTLLDPAG